MPLTNAQKQKAHRRRMADKMARYEGALREIALSHPVWISVNPEWAIEKAQEAIYPTDPAKS